MPPTFMAGQPVTAAQLNALALATIVFLAGTNDIISGKVFPANTVPTIQCGSTVLSATSGTISFGNAFSNGVLGIWISNGDANANTNAPVGAKGTTLSGFTAVISGSTATWRCNWLAIGW